jgi:hypothetical protein
MPVNHESAHAVVALFVGLEVHEAWIDRDEDPVREAKYDGFGGVADFSRTRAASGALD